MPSVTPEQERFFGIVHAIQAGKMSPTLVHESVRKAARVMNPNDVKAFLMESFGLQSCPVTSRQGLVKSLKQLKEDYSSQPTPEVVASSKRFHGDYKETLKGYRGYAFTPHENQAASNADTKPTVHNNFNVGFAKSDPVGNTSTIMIKKLREPDGQYVYTAIVKVRGGEDQEETPSEAPPESGAPPPQGGPQGGLPQGGPPPKPGLKEGAAGDEIKIIKSIPIATDYKSGDPADSISGDEILTNFIQTVYHKYA